MIEVLPICFCALFGLVTLELNTKTPKLTPYRIIKLSRAFQYNPQNLTVLNLNQQISFSSKKFILLFLNLNLKLRLVLFFKKL